MFGLSNAEVFLMAVMFMAGGWLLGLVIADVLNYRSKRRHAIDLKVDKERWAREYSEWEAGVRAKPPRPTDPTVTLGGESLLFALMGVLTPLYSRVTGKTRREALKQEIREAQREGHGYPPRPKDYQTPLPPPRVSDPGVTFKGG